MATAHPVQISIGATLAASLGSAVRSAQAQLNQLGTTMAELGNKQSGIKQLEDPARPGQGCRTGDACCPTESLRAGGEYRWPRW